MRNNYVIRQPGKNLWLVYVSASHHAWWTDNLKQATRFDNRQAKLLADNFSAIPISTEEYQVTDSGEADTIDRYCHL